MSQTSATQKKRILIVDDEAAVVKALTTRCGTLGIHVDTACDAAEAMKIIRSSVDRPDLLLLDFIMPGTDGLTLCEMLKADITLPPIPVILLTGYEDDETRYRCQEVGAHFVRKDVNSWQVLRPLIQRLLGLVVHGRPPLAAAALEDRRPDPAAEDVAPAGHKILIIDDDPTVAKGLKLHLQAAGMQVCTAYSGMQGYWMALKEEPDLILLDYKMPEGWGNTVLGKLKSNPLTHATPVVILSGMGDMGVQRDVIRMGAECWVNKPFDVPSLIELIQNAISKRLEGK